MKNEKLKKKINYIKLETSKTKSNKTTKLMN